MNSIEQIEAMMGAYGQGLLSQEALMAFLEGVETLDGPDLIGIEEPIMEKVTTNIYKTPTARNQDCQWSLGVMNLTEAEARLIAQYALGIRTSNSPRAQGVTADQMRDGFEINPATGGPWRCNTGRHALRARTSVCEVCAVEKAIVLDGSIVPERLSANISPALIRSGWTKVYNDTMQRVEFRSPSGLVYTPDLADGDYLVRVNPDEKTPLTETKVDDRPATDKRFSGLDLS